MLILYALMFAT